jgi:glycosyltransferase involved in cell wall biosynthesis
VPAADRVRLGWNSQEDDAWILRAGERESDRIQFEEWWDSADIVLCGERRFKRMSDRLAQGKLCFYMSERWWKPSVGRARLLHPVFVSMVMQFMRIAKNPKFHYLPVGPYAEIDISFLVKMKERIWRWGYFTSCPMLTATNNDQTNRSVKILWAGRMLDWKKVDTLIMALAELTRNHVAFELTLIGEGPERNRLVRLADTLLDAKKYVFLDPVPADQVPEIMSRHDVYVLPSSAYEGWGAVVNEAMACGCAVVASRETGAAAAMIEDGVNGFLFNPGDWRKLADLLCQLACGVELRRRLSNEAQGTINEVWSPRVVAERFYCVSEALLLDKDVPVYTSGPMSRSGR